MNCSTERLTVGSLWQDSGSIDSAPDYQREGGVWSPDRQQLFVDSVVNGYDIPKIYMNVVSDDPGTKFKWAIIDGKQRLTTVWAFMEDNLKLGEAFVMDPTIVQSHPTYGSPPVAGQPWSDLTTEWQQFIRDRVLDVVLIRNASEEDIEELFERLNNGEPLTAAEARNNIRGDMTDLVRKVADHKFFSENLKIKNSRYRHREISAKFLLLEETERSTGNLFSDLKKRHLDDLCDSHRSMKPGDRKVLLDRVSGQLTTLQKVFDKNDPLLSKMATPPLYYVWVKDMTERYGHRRLYSLMKNFLTDFEVTRKQNLQLPEEKQDPGLTEFSRRSQQATNDRENLRWRSNYLSREFLKANPEVKVKDKKRAFTDEERHVIWELGQRKCARCGEELADIDDMQADHIVQWSFGGETSLQNARCLCASCNQEIKETLS